MPAAVCQAAVCQAASTSLVLAATPFEWALEREQQARLGTAGG